MVILSVNRALNWVQILSDSGRRYTCITKSIDGVPHFLFKKQWRKVADFVGDHTLEMIEEGGKYVIRSLKK